MRNGQGAAEYILLFGGVIVIAIAALVIYNSYFTNQTFNTAQMLTLLELNQQQTTEQYKSFIRFNFI